MGLCLQSLQEKVRRLCKAEHLSPEPPSSKSVHVTGRDSSFGRPPSQWPLQDFSPARRSFTKTRSFVPLLLVFLLIHTLEFFLPMQRALPGLLPLPFCAVVPRLSTLTLISSLGFRRVFLLVGPISSLGFPLGSTAPPSPPEFPLSFFYFLRVSRVF